MAVDPGRMFRELAHFARHAPATLRLKRRLDQGALYDHLCARQDGLGLATWRAALCGDLRGRVVEIGAGTGLMFAHYPADAAVTAVEPDDGFAAIAGPRRAAAAATIAVARGTAEALPLPDASQDAAVFGLVLCSVAAPAAALAEARRVVRPGGAVRLLEHVRSPRPVAGALMRATNPLWRALNGQGCNMHRDPVPALAAAGLTVERIEAFQVFSPGMPAFPLRAIWARVP